jgi:hypothetical protein
MATAEWTEAELDTEYARALRAGRKAARSEPRAAAARYDAGSGRIVIELTSGATFMVPAGLLEGLADAAPEALAAVEVVPGGEGLHLPLLDADLSVPGLLAGVFGSRGWMRMRGRDGRRH